MPAFTFEKLSSPVSCPPEQPINDVAPADQVRPGKWRRVMDLLLRRSSPDLGGRVDMPKPRTTAH